MHTSLPDGAVRHHAINNNKSHNRPSLIFVSKNNQVQPLCIGKLPPLFPMRTLSMQDKDTIKIALTGKTHSQKRMVPKEVQSELRAPSCLQPETLKGFHWGYQPALPAVPSLPLELPKALLKDPLELQVILGNAQTAGNVATHLTILVSSTSCVVL